MIPMTDVEEAGKVSVAMRERGGSFVRALGAALNLADRDNLRRIKGAFPEYWAKYLAMAESTAPRGGARAR